MAQGGDFRGVELAVGQYHFGGAGERRRLLPAPRQQMGRGFLHATKIFRRRDVVIENDLAAGQRGKNVVHVRADGQVQQHDIRGPEIVAVGGEIARVATQFGQDAPGFAVNVGGVPPPPENLAHGPRLVADGIAIGKARDNLMNGPHGSFLPWRGII